MEGCPIKVSVIIAHQPGRNRVLLDQLLKDICKQLDELGIRKDIFVETEGSISSARNNAARRAQGEILVFLDDDAKLRRHFFQEILEPFNDHSIGVVGGVNMDMPGSTYWQKISASMMSSPLLWFRSCARYTPRGGIRDSDESELIACCLAVRKKAFDQAGGFPLDVIPCEENVLINRIQWLGWRVIYNPFAIVYHQRAPFPFGYARKLFEYGKGRGRMMRQNISGAPRSLWKPSWRWLFYALGVFIHFGAYILGVVYGYLIKRKGSDK